MAASSTPATGGGKMPRIGLTEWFTLRRYPLPDFYDSLDSLPASLADLAARSLPAGRRVQGILFVPPEYYARKMMAWEYVPERALIFLDAAALYLRAAGPDAPAESRLFDGASLLYVRSSLLLLYGLLEFRADCGAQPADVRLEYNTVIWQALGGPLARFVAGACPALPSGNEAQVRDANAAILKGLPFKFANGLRYYALESGECLRAAVFQPALWERRAMLPWQVAPNTLMAVTDGKVVLIEEKRSSIWRRQPMQGEYGWIFTYIPRDRVVDMVVTPQGRWAHLKMVLARGEAHDERTFLFDPAVAGEWVRAWRENQ